MNDPFSTEGKPYFFDQSTYDQIGTCYSCHPGGGPAEGIVQADGTVTPYDDPSLTPTHSYDRDFYTYSPDATTFALNSGMSIDETISAIGDPVPVDWQRSGIMEADCLLCHIDPNGPYQYRAADGLKVQTFRPRLMIFAQRKDGKVEKISLGMALDDGLQADSALNYTNHVQRMSRPTNMMALMQLPAKNVGEMMKMWTDRLKELEAQGVKLPYALYAPPEVVPGIWGPNGLKAEYCANPAGPADEMERLAASKQALDELFAQFLEYLKANGFLPPDAGMDQMMSVFFNDFIYAYQIKWPTGQLCQIPFGLRGYKKGAFYTDWDNSNGSVRDYMRAPLMEGQGIAYSGYTGRGVGAMMFAIQQYMQGNPAYMKPDGTPDIAKVFAEMETGQLPVEKISVALREYIPGFFNYMPTANLMGLDLNGDGTPLTYIQIVKNGDDWQAKAYYNLADLGDGNLKIELFGGVEDASSPKWVKICGQCHAMTKDHDNSNWTRARTYNLGMCADWVKNGRYINITDNPEEPGYEVHLSKGKMGCGACHLRETGDLEAKHNFLKGTDTAHMVRNDLDNNPKPKTCEYCHLSGGHPDAPNPAVAHEEKFGENTARHLAVLQCEACHIPFRKTWRFRAFDDTLGYYSNFDNRFGYNLLPGGDWSLMAFPGEYELSPVYGVSPGYGIPHFHMVSQRIDADGSGNIVPTDFVSQMVEYFNLNASSDPGLLVNGMPTNPNFDFWKFLYQFNMKQYQAEGVPLSFDPVNDNLTYPPLYYANGRNGYPQITTGNPITIMTWVDVNPEPDANMSSIAYGGAKILYLREINAAIDSFWLPATYGLIPRSELAAIPPNDPTYAANPEVGKIILKDSGYVIFDHTGDMFPDIWWPEDVRAMQEALIKVLKAEGETDPKPVIFLAAHYFSDSHGVQPKEYALGSKTCYDCHGDYRKDPGAHRITDRVITYLPWAPPWFTEENRLLRYEPESVPEDAPIWMKRAGMVLNNPDGFFVVDGEVAYIQPMHIDAMDFLGASEESILELSKHHAEELFYMVAEGTIQGHEIEEIDQSLLTDEEREMTYVRQVVNSPWNQKLYFYIPEELKPEIAECGFQPSAEEIYLEGKGMAHGYVLKLGFNEEVEEPVIIKLPYAGADPTIVTKTEEKGGFSKDPEAVILGQSGGFITVKVNHSGEFAAVDTNYLTAPNAEQWETFMKQ
ncbi:MAG: hypothetical protein GXO58_05620 [Thermodesulfobacteria bacterium]|nr:hypothetical protein [Thermodesulfobacteriota bacterium]